MKDWQKAELSDAEFFREIDGEGSTIKGSGNRWNNPGDVRSKRFLVQTKHTKSKSYSISSSTWDKTYEEALFTFKIPVLSLHLPDHNLIILERADFGRLLAQKELAKGEPLPEVNGLGDASSK